MDYSSNNYRGTTTTTTTTTTSRSSSNHYPAMIPEITERSTSSSYDDDNDDEVYSNEYVRRHRQARNSATIPDCSNDDSPVPLSLSGEQRRGSPTDARTHTQRTVTTTSSVLSGGSDHQRKPLPVARKEYPPGRDDDDDDDRKDNGTYSATTNRPTKFHDPRTTKLTGLCGTSISSTELVLILLIVSIIVGAIIGGVMYFLFLDDSGMANEDMTYVSPTVAPTPEIPQYDDINAMYDTLRLAVEKYQPAALDGMTLPDDPSYIIDSSMFPRTDVYRMNRWYATLNWMVTRDRRKHYTTETIQRFVVSFIFYEFGGYYWANRTNWLSSYHICDWYGVTCQDIEQTIPSILSSSSNETEATSWTRTERVVTELNLRNNSLKGTLSYVPFELLRDTIEVFDFKDNQLRGTIPGRTFGSLPKLRSLYLNYNDLSGTIPATLSSIGSLETLYVQGNNLTGTWPFCDKNNDDTATNGSTAFLTNYGLDCSQTPCPNGCCKSTQNCL